MEAAKLAQKLVHAHLVVEFSKFANCIWYIALMWHWRILSLLTIILAFSLIFTLTVVVVFFYFFNYYFFTLLSIVMLTLWSTENDNSSWKIKVNLYVFWCVSIGFYKNPNSYEWVGVRWGSGEHGIKHMPCLVDRGRDIEGSKWSVLYSY